MFGSTLLKASIGGAKVLPAEHALVLSFGIANAAKTDEAKVAYLLHLCLAFFVGAGARVNCLESMTVIFQSQIVTGFPLTTGLRRTRIVPRFSAGRSLTRSYQSG